MSKWYVCEVCEKLIEPIVADQNRPKTPDKCVIVHNKTGRFSIKEYLCCSVECAREALNDIEEDAVGEM